MNIHLGYEIGSGRAVSVPLTHTAVTGQTQASGKTTTLEALIHRSERRAIAFLTKRGEGTFQTSVPVAPYFSEAVDWEMVKELLEAQAKSKLRFETSWIIEVSKGAESLQDVQNNIRDAMGVDRETGDPLREKKGIKRRRVSSLAMSVYTVLSAYLAKLLPQIAALNYTTRLDLHPGLNVMDLTEYTTEMQGLVVRSVLEWVYQRERNVIVVIPEAWELLPQDRGSPVRLAAEIFIRKGAVLGNYLFLDSQDLAGVNKAILRQVGVWILGVQREANEVMRTLKQFISKPARPRPDDLMSLGKGQFFVAHGTAQSTVYVQPRWMNGVHAQAIATGDETIESAAAVYRDYLKQFKTLRASETRERASETEVNRSTERSPVQTGREIARSREVAAPTLETLAAHTPEGKREDAPHQRPKADTPAVPTHSKGTTMPDDTADGVQAIWPALRARILADPQVLAVLARPLEIRIIDQPKVLEMDSDTLPGQIATLIHEGFFAQPKKGYAVWQELVDRRRKKFAKPSVYDALDNTARLGFLVRDAEGRYAPVDGMKITRKIFTAELSGGMMKASQ